ncbi:serine/threonine protein kinase [Pseudozyma hubeiensis SY62]|uniref:Serine/threonine protein kinase n=1 Tax=Pseudozyma hubeiensis (strain SY62) TaxID=1305764 RepID=R9P7K4_PSEHS|nr:serine/threonine protein kinase [Pseudozyma hubeiensis SY62]GAC97314.1 serine/threonine protein kinase [Pseudozyma hubeiensis SY62]
MPSPSFPSDDPRSVDTLGAPNYPCSLRRFGALRPLCIVCTYRSLAFNNLAHVFSQQRIALNRLAVMIDATGEAGSKRRTKLCHSSQGSKRRKLPASKLPVSIKSSGTTASAATRIVIPHQSTVLARARAPMLHAFNATLPTDKFPPLSGDHQIDIQDLQAFLEHMFRPQLPTSFKLQIYLCIGIVSFLLVLCAPIVLQRLLYRRAWLFKLWHVGGGTFVIPNAVLAFLLLEALFGMLWIAYAIITLEHYRYHNYQRSYFAWRTLIWTVLWTGCWWTSFGLLSAFPDALTLKTKGRRQKSLILSPAVFNIACWGVPLLQYASILPLVIIDSRDNASVAAGFETWLDDVQVALRGAVPDAVFAQLRLRAMHLWLDMTEVYWYFGVIMASLCCWSIVALLVFMPVGAHVLLRIRLQLQLETLKMQAAGGRLVDRRLESGVDIDQDSPGLPRRSERFSATASGLPPLREPARPSPNSRPSSRTARERLVQNLKRLFKNLLVQYLGISVAILCFFFASGKDALQVYSAARRNDTIRTETQSILFAAWTMVVFASLTLFCTYRRSFDPSLSVDLSDEEPSTLAPRSVLVGLRTPLSHLWNKCSQSAASRVATEASGLECLTIQTGNEASSRPALLITTPTQSTLSVAADSCQCCWSAPASDRSGDTLVSSSKSCFKTSLTHKVAAVSPAVEIFFATPFGKMPAVPASALRPRIRSFSMNATDTRIACLDIEEELAPTSSNSSPGKQGYLRKDSTSSVKRRRSKRSRCSSISTKNAVVLSDHARAFAGYAQVAASGSNAPQKAESTPILARRISTAEVRSSRRIADAEEMHFVPQLDMEAKCFVPPGTLVKEDDKVKEDHEG